MLLRGAAEEQANLLGEDPLATHSTAEAAVTERTPSQGTDAIEHFGRAIRVGLLEPAPEYPLHGSRQPQQEPVGPLGSVLCRRAEDLRDLVVREARDHWRHGHAAWDAMIGDDPHGLQAITGM